MEVLGIAVTLCLLVVFLISLMRLPLAEKVFFITLILMFIIISSMYEAGIIFH